MNQSEKEMVKLLERYNQTFKITSYSIEWIVKDIIKEESLMEMWKKSPTISVFFQLVDASELKYSDVMLRLRNRSWYYRRAWLGDNGNVFKTSSDVGSLKIGNEQFYLLYPNGYGDGINRVAILPYSCLENCNRFFPRYLGFLHGSGLKIYEHDCSEDIAFELGNGSFYVYADERFFAIVRKQED